MVAEWCSARGLPLPGGGGGGLCGRRSQPGLRAPPSRESSRLRLLLRARRSAALGGAPSDLVFPEPRRFLPRLRPDAGPASSCLRRVLPWGFHPALLVGAVVDGAGLRAAVVVSISLGGAGFRAAVVVSTSVCSAGRQAAAIVLLGTPLLGSHKLQGWRPCRLRSSPLVRVEVFVAVLVFVVAGVCFGDLGESLSPLAAGEDNGYVRGHSSPVEGIVVHRTFRRVKTRPVYRAVDGGISMPLPSWRRWLAYSPVLTR